MTRVGLYATGGVGSAQSSEVKCYMKSTHILRDGRLCISVSMRVFR